jgi:hypothetical protein
MRSSHHSVVRDEEVFMSKLMIAVGSFGIGAISMFALLSGGQSLIWAQSPASSSSSGSYASPETISIDARVPRVPDIPVRFANLSFPSNQSEHLDGLSCTDCEFSGPLLIYGGGEYQLINATFAKGTIRVQLVGAAQNTFNLLRQLGFLRDPSFKGDMAVSKVPPTQTIELAKAITISLSSVHSETSKPGVVGSHSAPAAKP